MDGALGRARTAIPPCVPVCKSHSTLYCTAIPPCVPVCKSHSTLYRAAIPPRSTVAHCKVSTHYFLPSPPYSLLFYFYSIHAKTERRYAAYARETPILSR